MSMIIQSAVLHIPKLIEDGYVVILRCTSTSHFLAQTSSHSQGKKAASSTCVHEVLLANTPTPMKKSFTILIITKGWLVRTVLTHVPSKTSALACTQSKTCRIITLMDTTVTEDVATITPLHKDQGAAPTQRVLVALVRLLRAHPCCTLIQRHYQSLRRHFFFQACKLCLGITLHRSFIQTKQMELFTNMASLVIQAKSQAARVSKYLCTVCETIICCIVVEPSYLYIMSMN
mmetsp:Transcript_20247/g.31639  ORF Transcript_20247/g.31639 Transcript_20247/m.31639 type:complete len:232 (+) Transcript_20247:2111-2806(+)